MDLSDRSLIIYAAPGHTPGSIVIFDPQTGNLFTGDSFGSNSPTIPDALWLQGTRTPLDGYLAVVKNCRANFRGKVKAMMTGHNDRPLIGEQYLDNLESALQSLMDKGDVVLVPSYRPAGLLQVVVGDRLHDPNWVAINVNKEHYLTAPVDKIAGLTRIVAGDAKLVPVFSPDVKAYTVTVPASTTSIDIAAEPTSTRSQSLTIDGEEAQSGTPRRVKLAGGSSAAKIRVTSPDGTQSADYTLTINKE